MFKLAIQAAAALAFAASAASAATVGFDFSVSGDTDAPTFEITNTSDTAQLSFLSLDIGDNAFNFDDIQNVSGPNGGSANILFGDTVNDGSGVDLIGFTFSSFDAGDVMSWQSDIDADGGDSIVDYRTTLFNNADINNALLVAVFNTGDALRIEFPDLLAIHDEYTYKVTLDTATGDLEIKVAPIPLPAGLPLMGAGLLALGLLRSRRKA